MLIKYLLLLFLIANLYFGLINMRKHYMSTLLILSILLFSFQVFAEGAPEMVFRNKALILKLVCMINITASIH